MALPTKPALVKAFNKVSFGFALTVTTTAPTVVQLTATTGINLTCYAFGDQEMISQDVEKVTLPRLMCEATQYQSNGPVTYTMPDVQVSFSPQAAALSSGKGAWEKLVEGTAGWLWRRQGIAPDVDLAAGQFVDLIPVDVGPALPTQSGTGTDAVFTSLHPFSITGKPIFNIALV